MRFLSSLRRNRKTTKTIVEHISTGIIGNLCIDDGTLAIGFVNLTGSGKTDKVLYLAEWDGKDWATRQRFWLGDFLSIPTKRQGRIDLWNFWPKLKLEGDTLVFSREYALNPKTQPQRRLSSKPPDKDDLDEIYILRCQGDRWALDRTIGNSAPIAGFNSKASRIYKIYALALWGNTLAALVDGDNVASGLHIFQRVDQKWSLSQSVPLSCPKNWQKARDQPGPSSIFLNDDTLVVYMGAYSGEHELRIFERKDRRWSLKKVISEAQPLGALSMGSHIEADRADYCDYYYLVNFLGLGDNRLAIRVQENYAFEMIADTYILRRGKSGWELEANMAEECDPGDYNSYWQLEEESRRSGQLFGDDKIPPGIALMAHSFLGADQFTASKQGNRIVMTAYDEDKDNYKLFIFKKSGRDWSMEQEIASAEIADDTPFASNSQARDVPEFKKVALDDQTLVIHVAYPKWRIEGHNTTRHFDEHSVCVLARQDGKWQLKDRLFC